MNSVIISPPPSRPSSIRLNRPRMRAETMNVPNTWVGSQSLASSPRARKISHPTYSFYGEERAYDFPSKSHSSQLYADDDYRTAAGQFLDSTCPCSPSYSPEPVTTREENMNMENNKETTRDYQRFLLLVAAILLLILLVTGWYDHFVCKAISDKNVVVTSISIIW